MSRRPRGHLLLEAMVAGAVFLAAVGGLSGGLIAASRQVGIASKDQQTLLFARGQIDALQGRPITHPSWAVGVTGPAAIAGAEGFRMTTTITAVVEATGPVTLTYRHAVVRVTEGSGRSSSLEALRW